MAPTREQIKQMFAPLSQQGQQASFFDSVADDVHWTILGHSPMSKTYSNKKDFVDGTLTVLREKVLTEPLRLRVIHVTGGGDGDEWATIEMQSIDAKCKNGELPHPLTIQSRDFWTRN
jgi:ketosteroid isomerase-like protein